MEILDLLKLHFFRKENLAVQFSVSRKKIQDDTNALIIFFKGLGKATASKTEFLTYILSVPTSFYYALFDLAISNIEPEDVLRSMTGIKNNFLVDFPKEFDNIWLLRKTVVDLYNDNKEMESRIKRLEKLNGIN